MAAAAAAALNADKVAALKAEALKTGETVVSSLEEIEALLRKYEAGEKERGGVFIIMGSLEMSEANAFLNAVERLESVYSVKCPKSDKALGKINDMDRLHAHLYEISDQVNTLIDIARNAKELLKDVEPGEKRARAALRVAKARYRRAAPSQADQDTIKSAKQARAHALNAQKDAFNRLRVLARKATKGFKVGEVVIGEMKALRLEAVNLVGYVMSGEPMTDRILKSLAELNEVLLPRLRDLKVVLDPPTF